MGLPDELLERARTHPGGERLLGGAGPGTAARRIGLVAEEGIHPTEYVLPAGEEESKSHWKVALTLCRRCRFGPEVEAVVRIAYIVNEESREG